MKKENEVPVIRIDAVGQNGAVPESFLALPYTLYAGHACWSPRPVETTVRLLDTACSPFWQQAERELFVAVRNGQVVGRIAATDDRLVGHQDGGNVGYFGFFESIDDQSVADALLAAAGDWLRQRGRRTMRGPFCPSPYIYEFGLLIDGFDQPQSFGEAYHPAYYQRLLESYGLVKAADELSLSMPGRAPDGTLKEGVRRRIEARSGLRVRPFDAQQIERDLRIAVDVLNAQYASDAIYGADSFAVARFALESLVPFGDWGLCLIAEVHGEPAGIMITTPNYDDGYRARAALGEPARHAPDTNAPAASGSCVVELVLAPKFHNTRAGNALFYAFWDAVAARGYTYNRGCFVDEDNHACLALIAAYGGFVSKRFRVYETVLAAPD